VAGNDVLYMLATISFPYAKFSGDLEKKTEIR